MKFLVGKTPAQEGNSPTQDQLTQREQVLPCSSFVTDIPPSDAFFNVFAKELQEQLKNLPMIE
jgi:hypothetical protein